MKLFLILFLILICGPGYSKIKIEGSSEFIEMIQESIDFLTTNSPKTIKDLEQSITEIEEDFRSGADLDNHKIQINLRSCPDTEWCSAVLVHELVHFIQDKKGTYNFQTSRTNEYQANLVMLNYLKKIKADKGYIKYLQRLVDIKLDHSDFNGNGIEDNEDYFQRDW